MGVFSAVNAGAKVVISKGIEAGAAAVTQQMERAKPPPPPPPKAWCITLKRSPPLTPKDEPPIGPANKCMIQCCCIPPMAAAHLVGWGVYSCIQFTACTCVPVIGPAVLTEVCT